MSERYNPVWLPAEILRQEEALRRDYLGEDLNLICAAAAASGHLPFVATAAAPKKRREEVYEEWRVSNYRQFGLWCPVFADFMRSQDDGQAEKIRSGKVAWRDLEAAIQTFIAEREDAAKAVRRARKMRFCGALAAMVEDPNSRAGDCDVNHTQVPAAAVILDDQTTKYFRKLSTAKEWAARQGCYYLLLDLRRGVMMRRDPHGAKIDDPQETAHIADTASGSDPALGAGGANGSSDD